MEVMTKNVLYHTEVHWLSSRGKILMIIHQFRNEIGIFLGGNSLIYQMVSLVSSWIIELACVADKF
jgi:hypothetical protein